MGPHEKAKESFVNILFKPNGVCVCVCVCVFLCDCIRERERELLCDCMRDRENVCLYLRVNLR